MALVASLMQDMAAQADKERAASDAEIVSGLIVQRDEELLATLKEKRVTSKAIDVVASHLEADRKNRDDQKETDTWLGLSDVSERRLQHLLENVLPTRLDEACFIAGAAGGESA